MKGVTSLNFKKPRKTMITALKLDKNGNGLTELVEKHFQKNTNLNLFSDDIGLNLKILTRENYPKKRINQAS